MSAPTGKKDTGTNPCQKKLPKHVLSENHTEEMKMVEFVNLTPHAITLRSPEGTDTVIPPSGTIARVSSTPGEERAIAGFPVPVVGPDSFGEVVGLPEESIPGVFYIVSAVVGARVSRPDVLTPGTGPKDGPIRNEKGHVVAVTRLKATA